MNKKSQSRLCQFLVRINCNNRLNEIIDITYLVGIGVDFRFMFILGYSMCIRS